MDDERFDVWVKAVAATPDRRTTLRHLAGGLIGVALPRLAAATGVAQACGAPGKPCGAGCCPDLTCGAGDLCCIPNRVRKKCKKGGQCCSGLCKKKKGKKTGKCACLAKGKPCILATKHKCCGGRCNQNGQCDDACPGGQRDCGDGNCAECCGNAADCGADTTCRSWACTDDHCVPTNAPDTTQCGVQDGCTGDTFQAPGFCDGAGGCAQPPAEECVDDGNACSVNFCHSLAGCGAIGLEDGESCGDSRICCGGVCCAQGHSCCGGTCKDLQTDETSCGTCGNGCGQFGTCCSGTCTVLFLDPNNCGACGNRCSSTPSPVVSCCNGTCTFLGASPNCGGCGITCSASQICFTLLGSAYRCCKPRDAACQKHLEFECCSGACDGGQCL